MSTDTVIITKLGYEGLCKLRHWEPEMIGENEKEVNVSFWRRNSDHGHSSHSTLTQEEVIPTVNWSGLKYQSYHPRRIREVRGTQLSDPRFPVVLYTLRSPKGAALTSNKTLVHDLRGTETFSSVIKAKIFVHGLDQCGWWQMVTSSSKSDRISACDFTIQSPMWQPQH